MRAEEKNMVERIMNTETMGYAYEYPYGGGARKEYMLALTPENLANFIGARGYDAKKIVITDVLDRLIVNTCMGMLDICPDQKLCGRIIKYLAPIQLGEKEAGEILAVERNVADEYFAMEDEAVTMQNARCYRDCRGGRTIMIGILIVAAVGIIGFLLTAGIAFGIAGSYQID